MSLPSLAAAAMQITMRQPNHGTEQRRPFPVGIRRGDRGFAATFQDIAPAAFVDPFVAETIARIGGETTERPLDTSCEQLSAVAAIAPRGII